jgi:hypothetical protein
MEDALSIAVGGGSVSAVLATSDRPATLARFIYAPGAGSSLRDPFGAYAARLLAAAGIETLRFQFPYMEARRLAPDRTPVLEATWRAAIEASRAGGLPLIVGGRSMGGRIASQVAAQGVAVEGVALFAYPLHPPGRPEARRDAHLPAVAAPIFFCSGTRDAYATPEELEHLASALRNASLHLLEGADHGFASRSSRRVQREAWTEALSAFLDWSRRWTGEA